MNEETLEIYKLIVDPLEIEAEANTSVSSYLMQRAAFYANRLGIQKKKVKEFDIIKDPLSDCWILVFMCERCF